MSLSRPFSYNTNNPLNGSVQVGNIAASVIREQVNNNEAQWWAGPDETLGYVIAREFPNGRSAANGQLTGANIGFWRSKYKTEESFIELSEYVARLNNENITFQSGQSAKEWLNENGYWASFLSIDASGGLDL